ncbi:PREDICTED: LOB domain-containing protein 1-like [Prunus mume]|uniref:LOB domain-containing protein 1-like n=1 Tax=Prunus mume TaxID=102107 RepID=A0ABM0P1N9_PRUMU|nr:PREDICTED: LOB domain-containing protein 1-like [Prunus mume]
MDTQVVPVHSRVHQPCAACRMLRRRCDRNCSLAPYFPGEEIEKFAGVHKVFGASNVIKMIQMVEETRREDAVKALVFEARARLRDPVYGSTGAIFHLQKMIEELRSQLESIRSQVLELQQHRDQLLGILMNNVHCLEDDLFSTMQHDPMFGGDL